MTRYGRMTRLFAAGGLVALVCACDENRRGVDAPPPAPLAELEGVSELPYAEPAQVQYSQPEQAYPYAERAYGVQRAFYDAPPDYGFVYDDVSPYVWETADDWALYAEPWDDDYRYYYYEPGSAYPYFVRDRDYGYAYSAAGLLIAMFSSDGRYVPVDVVYRSAPVAGRYYARGHDLRRAGRRAEHIRVDQRAWVADAPRLTRSADPWLRAARDDRRWREWRERDGDRELRRFVAETQRRQAAAGEWRERTARQRVATIERGQDRLEAQAARDDRREAKDDRREDRREAAQDARNRAEADGRQADARQTERRRGALVQQQRRAADAQRDQVRREQRQVQTQRRQAQAVDQRGRQDRAEPPRRAEAASMRERQQRQAQGEAKRRQAEVQQRRKGEAKRPEQAQRQQAEPRQRQAQAERQPRREQAQQARSPSAAERGRPAATREDGGKDRGRGKDERRKD